ncbi:MAG: ATPase P [Desulfitobacteriaceae bacterium]|nr:ATPase P [Desulfitobacteriaceae bacterium]MDI6880402.1 ATPase P [Desulfitobacteriaceae bacterium]MDI6915099.1 ATPase P [Desulfitobacteriaceae bacterium]
MIHVDIPGLGTVDLEVLILDYNGTLAIDGVMLEPVKEAIGRLAKQLEIHVLTSDTFGTVVRQCQELPVQVKVLSGVDHSAEKEAYLKQFAPRQTVAIGNGSNDRLMLEKAQIGIVVMGPEGCSGKALQAADVMVGCIEDAFGLLLEPQRLVATLRR